MKIRGTELQCVTLCEMYSQGNTGRSHSLAPEVKEKMSPLLESGQKSGAAMWEGGQMEESGKFIRKIKSVMVGGRGYERDREEEHIPDFECVLREQRGVNVCSVCQQRHISAFACHLKCTTINVILLRLFWHWDHIQMWHRGLDLFALRKEEIERRGKWWSNH